MPSINSVFKVKSVWVLTYEKKKPIIGQYWNVTNVRDIWNVTNVRDRNFNCLISLLKHKTDADNDIVLIALYHNSSSQNMQMNYFETVHSYKYITYKHCKIQ